MTDKDTNPNDAYYWMNKKIDYGDVGWCLTDEEEKAREKNAIEMRKEIMGTVDGLEFLIEVDKREKERRARENHDGRQ